MQTITHIVTAHELRVLPRKRPHRYHRIERTGRATINRDRITRD